MDKIRKRIQLLLNKAANTPYPEEAKTFQEHAERLMVRHSIDSLDGVGDEPEFFTRNFQSVGVYRVVRHQGLIALMQSFPHLTGYQQNRPKVKNLVVVGTLAELDKFQHLAESLEQQCTHALKAWWPSYRPLDPTERPVTVRRSFTLGFYLRCAARFRELYEEEAESGALVLVNTRANQWMTANLDLRPSRKSGMRTGDRSGLAAGMAAAEDADLATKKREEVS